MINIEATVTLEHCLSSQKRYQIHCGGSRSGKTRSIAYYIIILAQEKKRTIQIARAKQSDAVKTVWRDFEQAMLSQNLWDPKCYNASNISYKFPNGSIVEVIVCKDEQSVRGGARDILWCNEGNEISIPIWRQLLIRTTEKIIIDYNPSQTTGDHWIYELEDTLPDEIDFYRTTWKDNPFLPDDQVADLIRFKKNDPEFYKVFGEGLRGMVSGLIYPVFTEFTKIPDNVDWTVIGVDWGFNDPSTAIRVAAKGNQLYLQELLYISGKTSSEIALLLKPLVGETENVYADHDPGKILDLQRVIGYERVKKAKKSVHAGIMTMKSFDLFACGENLIKELSRYRWKADAEGRPTDEPIEAWDHLLDAARYAVHTKNQEGTGDFDYSFSVKRR